MEKLSRSQKFAELRDNVTLSREEETFNATTSSYEEKLNNLQNAFERTVSPTPTPIQNVINDLNYNSASQPAQQYATPSQAYAAQGQYVAPQQQYVAPQQPQQQYVAPQQPQQQFVAPQQNVYQQPTYVQPQVAEPVESKPEIDDLQNFFSNFEKEISSIENGSEVNTNDVVNNIFDDGSNEDFFSQLMSDFNDEFSNPTPANEVPAQNPYVAPAEPQQTYAEPQQPVMQNTITQNDVNSFVGNVFNEVNDYNKNEGRMTADQISNTIINDVRNNTENVVPTPINVTPIQSQPIQESLSNQDIDKTLSLEIDKIMDGISKQSEPQPVYNQPVQPQVKTNPVIDDFLSNPVNEHPVAAQAQEEVDIVNLAEVERRETLAKTIPFKVEEVDSVEYEQEDDTPNKVLNIILTVLIFALVGVLGFVIYQLVASHIL